ncbi:MAG TPA: hypothetical protein VMB04_11950 [Mycobacterium sp.]|nr:hypothetical protein [Mycobacterium sp.]
MVSLREKKKIRAAFDKLDATLDRIAEIPPHELTFEKRLTLWAQLETLRLALADAAQRWQRAAS